MSYHPLDESLSRGHLSDIHALLEGMAIHLDDRTYTPDGEARFKSPGKIRSGRLALRCAMQREKDPETPFNSVLIASIPSGFSRWFRSRVIKDGNSVDPVVDFCVESWESGISPNDVIENVESET